jgi:glycosyltransferase involved in cell wall biosynthesis
MLRGKKIAVVLPAYNAAQTLEHTYREIPHDLVDEVILVDDSSADNTSALAESLGIRTIIRHEKNRGYGANQKTCYHAALATGADFIIMLHPDYQYTPLLLRPIAEILASGLYPVVFASRILGNGALKGGMPRYKYLANRVLTLAQNILMDQKLSEYHTGYRGFTREVLDSLPFDGNSDDFVFDNQMAAQILFAGYEIAEITCPTRYFPEASSINFSRSIKYGFGVLNTSLQYFLHKKGIRSSSLFPKKP